MAKTTLRSLSFCPLYHSDCSKPYSISCRNKNEPIIKKIFKNKSDKDEHAKAYCLTKYCEECDVYKTITEEKDSENDIDRDSVNILYLKMILREKDLGFKYLAYILNMNRTTLYKKLKRGPSAFSVADYYTIKEKLDLSMRDMDKIFNI